MRSLGILVTTLVAAISLPISVAAVAQNAAPQNAAEAEAEVARQNAITDRYLTAVQVEMASKVDTKNAAVGQEFSARTLGEARLADGTLLPKGAKLVGHVLQVRPGGPEASAVLTLAFDHAEVTGKSVAVRSVIRAVAPLAPVAQNRDMSAELPSMMGGSGGYGGQTTGRGSGRGGVA